MKHDVILYTTKNKGFLYSREELCCDVCEQSLLRGGYYLECYDRLLPPCKKLLCGHCYKDDKNKPIGYDLVNDSIMVCGYVPDGALVWNASPPKLVQAKNLDTFTLADKQVGSEEVVDRTVISGASHAVLGGPEGVRIGLPEHAVRDPSQEVADALLALSARPVSDEALYLLEDDHE